MVTKERLLQRLDAIGQSLAEHDTALALIGLGSVGVELDRLDEYSDLDFFAIVQDGTQEQYIQNLDWLRAVSPISYCFMNTTVGYKVLFADGIFAEMAVFGLGELAHMEFPVGRIVWKAAGVDAALLTPQRTAAPRPPRPAEEALGEALTNLYVGIGRYRRGERLSALRFIQGYAVDRILELAGRIEAAQPAHPDAYAGERRVEQRFPTLAQALPQFMQGYDRSLESALAILAFLEQHWTVDPAIKQAILDALPPDMRPS
jgi:hypothetical protein